jgi:5-methylcytosine-specific restriction endonuclease McrA
MTKKQQRELVLNKYDKRCAYCGRELQKGWHVDELKPVKRNYKWNKNKTRYITDGTCENPENYNIDNQMPSCPSCNINKHSLSLEDFRKLIEGFIKSLNKKSTQYKIAKRYGFITENIQPVVFYFEKFNEEKILTNTPEMRIRQSENNFNHGN